MKKVLFVKLTNSSFVVQDENILKRHYQVTSYTFGVDKGIGVLFNQLKVFKFLISNIKKFDIIFIWFADFHSLLPSFFSKIFSKRTFIVLGGYDVAKIKEISYGAHLSLIRSWIIKQSLKNTDIALPVSNYTLEQAKINISPNVEEKAKVLYNAIDTDFFNYNGETKNNTIVSVCGSNDIPRAELKGVFHFIEISKRLPNLNFVLVGIGENIYDRVESVAPNNLAIKKFLPRNELKELYCTSKIVCQLSTIESFGVAVAEAMACHCIPIVNNVGGLKEVVQNNGYRINRDNYKEITTSILNAIDNFEKDSKNLGLFVKRNFSMQSREKKLIDIINHN